MGKEEKNNIEDQALDNEQEIGQESISKAIEELSIKEQLERAKDAIKELEETCDSFKD